MNDEEFLRYFELHSRTERALFSRGHVVRLMQLAFGDKVPPGTMKTWPAFVAVRGVSADYYVGLARKRMRQPSLRVVQGGKQ